ncbi:MAG: SH3 domain-containing protein [Pseudomonadota bacterium]
MSPRLNSCISAVFAMVVVLAGTLAVVPAAFADEKPLRTVEVADPYLEMHTGPGKGYPITNVVERGESVQIVRRKTDWFKVRTDRGREGWVNIVQLELTLDEFGERTAIERIGRDEFLQTRWETGIMTGDFAGSDALAVYGGYSISRNLSVEVWGSQLVGNFSNGWLGTVNVVHETFPEWRVSPYFTIGTGIVSTSPKSTLVSQEDRTDQVALVGGGFRAYVTRRFVLRAEYKSYVVLTSRDENEEVEEWKVGFGFFF